MTPPQAPLIAIACGGTGGHLFPGLAVAEQLLKRGCAVTLLVSPKEVDQQAVKAALERRAPARREDVQQIERAEQALGAPIQAVTLPAVGLQNRNYFSFAISFVRSYFAARRIFRDSRPAAVLAMGGFTSAPPVLAARKLGAKTFLHESNTIPGRANRWLSRFVDQCFVGFAQAAEQLHKRNVTVTGTPVRPQFQPRDPASCRTALGLEAGCATVLVMGGSQGASGINELVVNSLGLLSREHRTSNIEHRTSNETSPGALSASSSRPSPPLRGGEGEDRALGCSGAQSAGSLDELSRGRQLQFLHLTGSSDVEKVRQAYAQTGLRAIIHPFFDRMELALGAATVAVSRSGASSLAEIAAVRVPSVLIPFPAATDNHQFFNAKAFEETGAARLLEQKGGTPETLVRLMLELIGDAGVRDRMQAALAKWHMPRAAEQIAETIIEVAACENEPAGIRSHNTGSSCQCGEQHRGQLRANTAA